MKIRLKRTFSMCLAMLLFLTSAATSASAAEAGNSVDPGTSSPSYQVTVAETEHGTVNIKEESKKDSYSTGDVVSLEVKPDDGYVTDSIKVSDPDGYAVELKDSDGNTVTENYPNEVLFTVPDADMTVKATFVEEKNNDERGNDTYSEDEPLYTDADNLETVSSDSIMEMMGANQPLAAQMSTASQIATYAAASFKVRRAVAEEMNGAYTVYDYASDTNHGTESALFTDTGLQVFCIQPTTDLPTSMVGGVNYVSYGDGYAWLNANYGWSMGKINRISQAIQAVDKMNLYSEHGKDAWKCRYALKQNILWSSITSGPQSGRYILTDTKKYYCDHLNSREDLNDALTAVWNYVNNYDRLPSYNKQTKVVNIDANNQIVLDDTNQVTDQLEITWNPAGLQITKEKGKLVINNASSLAGHSYTISYKKNWGITTNAAETALIYQSESHPNTEQKVSAWQSAVNPVFGSVKIVVNNRNGSYMHATYSGRDKITPTFDIHIEKSDVDTGEKLAGAVFDIYMDKDKVATVTTDSEGKAAYHWRGNVLWTDPRSDSQPVNSWSEWSSKYNTAKANVQKAVEADVKALRENTYHTWKVVEVKAPDDYELNEKVWEERLNLDVHAVEVDFTNEARGWLNLNKVSADPTLVANNPCYSLEGAVYGVYKSAGEATSDTNRVATLTTDANGASNTVQLRKGTYFVKELTASKGYEICNEKDETDQTLAAGIHKVVVKPKLTTTFTCTEKPGNDPFALSLSKMDKETGKVAEARGDTSLEGAIFELAYYTNTDGSTSGTPFKKWYFRTNVDGYLNCDEPEYLVSSYTMNNGTKLISDDLFINSSGTVNYPIGTYTFKEVSAPKFFDNSGTMNFKENTSSADVRTGLKAIIKQDNNGEAPHIYDGNNIVSGWINANNLSMNAFDITHKGSITVYKKTADGTKRPLQGVTFKLVGVTEGDEHVATTDADGKLEWTDLIAQKYVITEIKTVDGMSLMKDNIEVNMPMTMTLDEINANGADINQAVFDEVEGKYCFYDLTFTVDNSISFDMPITGGNQTVMYVVMIGGLAAVAGALWIILRKKKK